MESIREDQHNFIKQIALQHEQQLDKQYHDYQHSDFSVGLREESLARGLRYKTDIVFAEVQGNQIIGLIWGRILKETNTMKIEMLYVDEDYRGKGIATSLKNALEKKAFSINVKRIETTVQNNNEMMKQMNRERGYKIEKVHMVKDLTINSEDDRK